MLWISATLYRWDSLAGCFSVLQCISVTHWLVHISHIDWFIYVPWLIDVYIHMYIYTGSSEITGQSVRTRHDSFKHVTCLIYICDMTHSHTWHNSFIYMTWLIHRYNRTDSYIRHDSFEFVPWLIYMYLRIYTGLSEIIRQILRAKFSVPACGGHEHR